MNEQQQNEQQNEQPQDGANGTQQQAAQPLNFERWIAEQPEEVRGLVDTQLDRLKTALDSERTARTSLDKQLKAISKQAGDDTALKAQIDKLAEDNREAGSKAEFYEAAHGAGVRNLRLAWVAAKEMGLMEDGKVDFAKLKEVAPELFAVVTATPKIPNAHAGAGAGQAGAARPSMNNFLRAAAGR